MAARAVLLTTRALFNLAAVDRYRLHVDEDPADALKPKTTYKAAKEDDGLLGGKRSEGCSCLFGNPCATPDPCKDWHNRFDVAKKNGWKGF